MRLWTLAATAAMAVVMTTTMAAAQSANTQSQQLPGANYFGPRQVGSMCFRGMGREGFGYWRDCAASGRTAQASGASAARRRPAARR